MTGHFKLYYRYTSWFRYYCKEFYNSWIFSVISVIIFFRPVVTYGTETWCLSAVDSQKLKVLELRFETDIDHHIFFSYIFALIREVRVGEIWIVRTRQEVEQLLLNDHIVNFNRTSRLHSASCSNTDDSRRVQRRNDDDVRRGSPRSGWLVKMEVDATLLGVRRWRPAALDRRFWRSVVTSTCSDGE